MKSKAERAGKGEEDGKGDEVEGEGDGQGDGQGYEDEEDGEDDEEMEDDEDDEMATGDDPLDKVQSLDSNARKARKHSHFAVDKTALKKVVQIITKRLQAGDETIAFALQRLSRNSSILPEFLKGMDALLYNALVEFCDVSLTLTHSADARIVMSVIGDVAYIDAPMVSVNRWNGDESEGEDELEGEDAGKSKDGESMNVDKKKLPFHVPTTSAITMIGSLGFIGYTENHAQAGESQYIREWDVRSLRAFPKLYR
jgi:hypothetical protein